MSSVKLYHTVFSKFFYFYKLTGVMTEFQKCQFLQASLSYFVFAENMQNIFYLSSSTSYTKE